MLLTPYTSQDSPLDPNTPGSDPKRQECRVQLRNLGLTDRKSGEVFTENHRVWRGGHLNLSSPECPEEVTFGFSKFLMSFWVELHKNKAKAAELIIPLCLNLGRISKQKDPPKKQNKTKKVHVYKYTFRDADKTTSLGCDYFRCCLQPSE